MATIVTRAGKGSALTWAEADANFTNLNTKLAEFISVKDSGATGDGATDDTTAIQSAITLALASTTGATLYFPPGIYLISSTLTADGTLNSSAKLNIAGAGIGATTIKCKAGFSGSSILHFGPGASSTTRTTLGGVRNLSLDGNNLGTVAGLYIRNAYRCVFENLSIDNCVGDGLYTSGHTSGVAGDPCNQGNVFSNIYSRANSKTGFYFRGEKSSIVNLCQADGNTEQGFFFDSETVGGNTETTECIIGDLISKNNTGAGFAFSGISKYSVGNVEAYINGGPGVHFIPTRSGTTASSSYSNFGTIVSRNNLGAVITATGTVNNYLQGCNFNSILHAGGKGLGVAPVEAEAIKIAGWVGCTICNINSELNIGTSLRIVAQTGSQETTRLTIDSVMLYSNGNSAATLNHGVSIENSSVVTIGKLHSENSYTTTAKTSYELITSATASAVIGNLYLYAAEAAREVSIGNQSLVTLSGISNIRTLQAERMTTSLNSASEIVAYGTYANEFWDNSSAIRKYVRMPDSTLRLLSGEKGTFTPAITFATPGDLSVSYSNQVGRYEVRGSKCFVEILLATSAFTHTTASGGLRITGLPFAAAASSNDGSALTGFGGITKANFTQFCVLTQNSQTYCVVYASGSGQAFTAVTHSDVPTSGTVFLKVAFDYEVDLPLA